MMTLNFFDKYYNKFILILIGVSIVLDFFWLFAHSNVTLFIISEFLESICSDSAFNPSNSFPPIYLFLRYNFDDFEGNPQINIDSADNNALAIQEQLSNNPKISNSVRQHIQHGRQNIRASLKNHFRSSLIVTIPI